MLKMNQIMFRPHLDMLIDVCGLPGKYKNLSWYKTDCCNVVSDFFYRKSIAPSSCDFCRRPPPRSTCLQVQKFWRFFYYSKLLTEGFFYILPPIGEAVEAWMSTTVNLAH